MSKCYVARDEGLHRLLPESSFTVAIKRLDLVEHQLAGCCMGGANSDLLAAPINRPAIDVPAVATENSHTIT